MSSLRVALRQSQELSQATSPTSKPPTKRAATRKATKKRAAPTKAPTIRAVAPSKPTSKSKRRRRQADAGAAAAAAADADVEADGMEWACNCGVAGGTHTEENEFLKCAGCGTWHHEQCSFDLLKGKDEVSKWALLRSGTTFECFRCDPSRYTWFFRCPCLKNGAIVEGWDDDKDQVECKVCRRWSHPSCATHVQAAEPDDFTCGFCATTSRHHGDPPEHLRYDADTKTFAVVVARSASSALAGHVSDILPAAGATADIKLVSSPRLELYIRRDASYRDAGIVDEVIHRGCYERPNFRSGGLSVASMCR